MGGIKLCLAILVALVTANEAMAQGTIKFDSGYPQTGGSSGQIAVKGSIALDCGWTLSGGTGNITIRTWQDGSIVSTSTFLKVSGSGSSYTFDGNADSLSSCASYNVTVEITVINNCCVTETISTVPAVATAK